ncbi:hypothetical protein [Natronobacterium texcoconense]|uniref:Uncharacterized protein n=1 Tax=Natronobacterium texcoconense TaxID=1095778 RepID=A0A1H1HZE2_NATTX|nr:hypothetical protein [Natronobacterium texcoconense]SDR30827.1 hypothetical protein SAMN04489842_3179 [Natronobacterium texcoconense]
MAALHTSSTELVRTYVTGEDAELAVLVVGLISVGVTVSLGLIPLLGLGDSGQSLLETIAFGVLPGIGGLICGWYSLGAIAAIGVGIAPGFVMYLYQVVLGTNGDLSRIGFSLMLTSVSLPIALVGFAAGIGAALLFR